MTINVLGSNREPLFMASEQDIEKMRSSQVLVTDPRRSRPRWFDGRFLAARDLANEQNYFLVRQSDIGRAGGCGVIEGLMVSEGTDSQTNTSRLKIEAGYGFTDTGEMVVIPEKLEINPSNIPESLRLDAAFGLQAIPTEPGRTRTGLYVIGLRCVEWTANQIAAYPVSLTGERTVQDGDIIEGVVVSLIPYPDNGNDEWEQRRARVAREIFLNGKNYGQVSGFLPLGIMALQGNQIVWVDPYLARRDAGADRPVGMDFGLGKRALREAQLLQYENHLVDVFNTLGGKGFEASAWFDVLPPAGRLPAQAVKAASLTHTFFPPTMKVEFGFLPEDELTALIEESFSLPPIDLQATRESLSSVGVVILAPMERDEFVKNEKELSGTTIKLKAPVREMKGNIRTLEFTANFRKENGLKDVVLNDGELTSAADGWTNMITTAQDKPFFWYVRRRYMPTAVNNPGIIVDASHPGIANPTALYKLIKSDPNIASLWKKIQKNGSPEVKLLLKRFQKTQILQQPMVIKSLLSDAASLENPTDEDIIRALAPVANPELGKGLRLIKESSLAKTLSKEKIAETGALAEVDRLLRETPEEKREEVIAAIRDAVKKPATLAMSMMNLRTKIQG